MKTTGIISLFLTLIMMISGCKREDENSSESIYSIHNETESHNNGQVCQSCHSSGGSGEGWFTLAGSVYSQNLTSANPNGNIYLYTGPNGTGTLVGTIEVDGKGNFFTTNASIPASGVYVQIKGTSGTIKNMSQLVTSGNCNNCHGGSTEKIWIN